MRKGVHTVGTFTRVVGTLLLLGAVPWVSVSAHAAAWQDELARVTKAAVEEEGELAVFSGNSTNLHIPAFQKAFPGIKLKFLQLRGTDVSQRLPAEQRAGKFVWDIVVNGGTTGVDVTLPRVYFSHLRDYFINPEITRDETWVGKFEDLWVDDKSKTFKIQFKSSASGGGTFDVNRKLLPESKFNKAQDLFRPELKGKICTFDPRRGGHSDSNWGAIMAQFGEEFLQRLYAEQKVVISRNTTKLARDLMRGKYLVCIGSGMSLFRLEGVGGHVKRFEIRSGVIHAKYRDRVTVNCCGEGKNATTIDGFMGGGSANNMLEVAKNPPHPNATKVFVNWLLSREGQKAWLIKTDRDCSMRADLHNSFCKETLNKTDPEQFWPVQDGKSYVNLHRQSNRFLRGRGREIAIKVFGR